MFLLILNERQQMKHNKEEWKFVLDRFIPLSEVEAALPHKYSMELNKQDMIIVMQALHDAGTEDAEMLLRDIFTTLEIE